MHGSLARGRAIFDQVSELPLDAREAALADACGGDVDVMRTVQRWLDLSERTATVLDTSPAGLGGPHEPRVVGPYRLLRKLGEGGLGRVYLAEPGPVAVKLVRPDVAPEIVARRFARERALLARLEHPGIARLLGGGTADDGTPYIVLRYVDGVPLDRYCAEHALTCRDRLAMMVQVCRAVAHAHSHGVLHRDLKPANVLVETSGRPVVLDFGLATLVDIDPALALDSTSTGHRMLTPDYASPEQVQGYRPSPQTDVYALGAMLYEVLTGVRPHRFPTWSLADIIHVVCSGAVALPSEAITDPAWPVLAHELRGALDALVMKALAKDPGARFARVDALQAHLVRAGGHA